MGRLESAGRLLRRPFLPGFIQIAAQDSGTKLRLLQPTDVAPGFEGIDHVWQSIDQHMDARLSGYGLVGSAPFWFLDCDDWPASAFLTAPNFIPWVQGQVRAPLSGAGGKHRPLMVAAFSAEQLLIGFADSAEFHDRLGHARAAPAHRPLMPHPMLLTPPPLPGSIRKIVRIEVHLGNRVRLWPQNNAPIDVPLTQ